MGFYIPDSTWPYAFAALVIFLTIVIIILHKLYERLGKTNALLISTMDRADRLQKAMDNIIAGRDELCECLKSATTDEEKVACLNRIAMGSQKEGR